MQSQPSTNNRSVSMNDYAGISKELASPKPQYQPLEYIKYFFQMKKMEEEYDKLSV